MSEARVEGLEWQDDPTSYFVCEALSRKWKLRYWISRTLEGYEGLINSRIDVPRGVLRGLFEPVAKGATVEEVKEKIQAIEDNQRAPFPFVDCKITWEVTESSWGGTPADGASKPPGDRILKD